MVVLPQDPLKTAVEKYPEAADQHLFSSSHGRKRNQKYNLLLNDGVLKNETGKCLLAFATLTRIEGNIFPIVFTNALTTESDVFNNYFLKQIEQHKTSLQVYQTAAGSPHWTTIDYRASDNIPAQKARSDFATLFWNAIAANQYTGLEQETRLFTNNNIAAIANCLQNNEEGSAFINRLKTTALKDHINFDQLQQLTRSTSEPALRINTEPRANRSESGGTPHSLLATPLALFSALKRKFSSGPRHLGEDNRGEELKVSPRN